jgi:hypothetical protein
MTGVPFTDAELREMAAVDAAMDRYRHDEAPPATAEDAAWDHEYRQRLLGLLAAHGQPVPYRDVAGALALAGQDGGAAGLACAWRYPDAGVAAAWHQLNADRYGHRSLGIVPAPDGGGVIGVLALTVAPRR